MAGIKDVAQEAGVSVGTVSNVLNGRKGRTSTETRARVLAAVEKLQYTPNAAARQLKSGLTQTLGLVVPSVANPFWGAVSHHVERAALEFGYKVLVCNAEREVAREATYAEDMLGSSIRGVIFGSSPVSMDHLRDLAARGLRVAAFDRRSRGASGVVACSVSIDQELGGRFAARHLIGLGHQRIAFVSGPISTSSRIGRLAGLRAAMEEAGLVLEDRHIWQGATRPGFGDTEGAQLGRAAVRELLAQRDPPTAIFTANDMYALGAYAGARDIGARVPGDISIVGFDDIVFAEIMQPPLTTIRQPIGRMSEIIVRRLIHDLEDGRRGDAGGGAHVDITPELVVRASTAPPPDHGRGNS
ncbi:LacI family DNA-binding transcriptional regulator [Rhodobacteraceae bacterium 2CG4]|uniref:LacI family DNA-binding transcriptional regulator n=1 Tax=Halovulum marinum TaxID=2662447 RepID=A0A6L5YZ20_9RHOB|nr:LacI family DNA-binding transcriptional regulator [Halovulum marinum]MSU89112.1 LacI family DNA-binding transcriptional regulator [Halovulum marinum]